MFLYNSRQETNTGLMVVVGMLVYRQKVLLALLDALGGKQHATDFQKYLFLYTTTCEKDKSYDFVPYRYGCYSFQASIDRLKLIEKGYLVDGSDWELAKTGLNYAHALKKGDETKIGLFSGRFNTFSGKKLIRYVYTKYPYFAINSEIAASALSEQELALVHAAKPPKRRKPVLATIGYEGGSVEDYLNRLIVNDIRVLIDVRKNPLSRKYGFSKKTLSSLLERLGIEYIHIPELGIESSQRQDLSSQSDYDRLFTVYEQTVLREQVNALDRVMDVYNENKRIALTCFEKEHLQCHRGRIAQKLSSLYGGVELQHL